MTAQVVREAFRTKVADLLTADGFEFVESVNRAEASKQLPPRWYTLDFVGADDSRIALGRPSLFRETGSTLVVVFTEQQIGDDVATAAADKVRDALANWADLAGQLRVLDCGPPTELNGGDMRGAWYGVTVDARYQFDRFVN